MDGVQPVSFLQPAETDPERANADTPGPAYDTSPHQEDDTSLLLEGGVAGPQASAGSDTNLLRGLNSSTETVDGQPKPILSHIDGERPVSRRGSSRGSAGSLSSQLQSPRPSGAQDRPPSRQSSRGPSAAGSHRTDPAASEASGSLGLPSPRSSQSSMPGPIHQGGAATRSSGRLTADSSRQSVASGYRSPRDRLLARSRSRSGSGTPEASQENIDPASGLPLPFHLSGAQNDAVPITTRKEVSEERSWSAASNQASAGPKPPSAQASLMSSRENSMPDIGARSGKPPSVAASAAGSRRSSNGSQDPSRASLGSATASMPAPVTEDPSAAGSRISGTAIPDTTQHSTPDALPEDPSQGSSGNPALAGDEQPSASRLRSSDGTPRPSQDDAPSRSSSTPSDRGTMHQQNEGADASASAPVQNSGASSRAASAAGSVPKASSTRSTPRASRDGSAIMSIEGVSKEGSIEGSQKPQLLDVDGQGIVREPSVAEHLSFLEPAVTGGVQAETPHQGQASLQTEATEHSSSLKKPKPSCTPKEVPMRGPEWCLQMFGNETAEITREDLKELLKDYCQDGRVLRLSAHEFNHMDFDCNGTLNRDEFYFFFYGWLAQKVPLDEDIYLDPRLREEAHQLCWIFDVYRCISGLPLDMSLRPWTALCSDAGLFNQHFLKRDAEMIFKKTIRMSCNAAGSEVKAGIDYLEFLEALRLVSVKKKTSLAEVIEDVIFVGASHRTNLGRNRFRDLANSSLTPMLEPMTVEPGELHASLISELQAPRSVSFKESHGNGTLSTARSSTLARTTGQASSFYGNLHWNESTSTWRPRKATVETVNFVTTSAARETPATEMFTGFEQQHAPTVPAPLSEKNVRISERETELELQLADMTALRNQGEEDISHLQDKVRKMDERIAMMSGENGALTDRISRLEAQAQEAESAKQAANEYIALLEQNLAVATADAVASAQSNENAMVGMQAPDDRFATKLSAKPSIMEHLELRREARNQSREGRRSPTSRVAFAA